MAKEVTLRVDLDEETSDKFLKIKDRLGVKNNTEVIRILIENAASVEAIV